MPSNRLSKEDVLTAYRRSALLQAAVRVFGESGFEGATMDRIAREADVAKGTIYLYYPSKQSIYDAAISAGFAELDERTRRPAESAATLRDAISGFITARAGYFFEHPDFFRIYVAAIARQITGKRSPGAPAATRWWSSRHAGSSRPSAGRSRAGRSAASIRPPPRSRSSISPAGSWHAG